MCKVKELLLNEMQSDFNRETQGNCSWYLNRSFKCHNENTGASAASGGVSKTVDHESSDVDEQNSESADDDDDDSADSTCSPDTSSVSIIPDMNTPDMPIGETETETETGDDNKNIKKSDNESKNENKTESDNDSNGSSSSDSVCDCSDCENNEKDKKETRQRVKPIEKEKEKEKGKAKSKARKEKEKDKVGHDHELRKETKIAKTEKIDIHERKEKEKRKKERKDKDKDKDKDKMQTFSSIVSFEKFLNDNINICNNNDIILSRISEILSNFEILNKDVFIQFVIGISSIICGRFDIATHCYNLLSQLVLHRDDKTSLNLNLNWKSIDKHSVSQIINDNDLKECMIHGLNKICFAFKFLHVKEYLIEFILDDIVMKNHNHLNDRCVIYNDQRDNMFFQYNLYNIFTNSQCGEEFFHQLNQLFPLIMNDNNDSININSNGKKEKEKNDMFYWLQFFKNDNNGKGINRLICLFGLDFENACPNALENIKTWFKVYGH